VRVDLDYSEDSRAAVDCNVVMNAAGEFVEVQGSAEGRPFSRGQLDEMLSAASAAIDALIARQREAITAATQ